MQQQNQQTRATGHFLRNGTQMRAHGQTAQIGCHRASSTTDGPAVISRALCRDHWYTNGGPLGPEPSDAGHGG
eukprot:1374628-Pyramimonas_sp.AAC.1